MNPSPIARELSFEVLQRRARRFELTLPQGDSTRQRLVAFPSRAWIGDVDESDCARPIEDVRSSGLDLSLIPYLPLMNGRED